MVAKKIPDVPKSVVRERLLDTADSLFYREGVRAVGIDRVLAEAGAAKASLYAHFRSKDDLIAAHVERRVETARAAIEAYLADVPLAERGIRFFDWMIEWVRSPEFRGCPLQHIAAELCDSKHPARKVAAGQRKWFQLRFLEWARAAGVSDPVAVSGALVVLFDGAIAAAEQDGPRRALDARWVAQKLLSS